MRSALQFSVQTELVRALWGLRSSRRGSSVSELKSGKHYSNFSCWPLAAWSNTQVPCAVSLVALIPPCLIQCVVYKESCYEFVRQICFSASSRSWQKGIFSPPVVPNTGVKNWLRSKAFISSLPLFHVLEWILGPGEHLLKQFLFPTLIRLFENMRIEW